MKGRPNGRPFFLSRHHKHPRVFPLGMAQHLVGEVGAAAHLLKQFLRLVELSQLAVNLRQLKVDLLLGVFFQQGQQTFQVFGEVLIVSDEQFLTFTIDTS